MVIFNFELTIYGEMFNYNNFGDQYLFTWLDVAESNKFQIYLNPKVSGNDINVELYYKHGPIPSTLVMLNSITYNFPVFTGE